MSTLVRTSGHEFRDLHNSVFNHSTKNQNVTATTGRQDRKEYV